MATYKEIQRTVKERFGFVAKTCWIASVLSEHGMTSRQAPNRISPKSRVYPCPPDKWKDITSVLRSLSMIPEPEVKVSKLTESEAVKRIEDVTELIRRMDRNPFAKHKTGDMVCVKVQDYNAMRVMVVNHFLGQTSLGPTTRSSLFDELMEPFQCEFCNGSGLSGLEDNEPCGECRDQEWNEFQKSKLCIVCKDNDKHEGLDYCKGCIEQKMEE